MREAAVNLLALVLASCGGRAAIPSRMPTATMDPPIGRPLASVDLATDAGAALVAASWRFVDARIDDISSPTPGADLRPSGPLGPTHDVMPRPGREGWDDAAWSAIGASELGARRGGGHLSFGWYRVTIELPARLGAHDVEGRVVALEVVADDYGEVWIDGRLPRRVGERGVSVVAGFNAPNRVVLTERAHAGQRFDVAIFVMNGPVSVSPENFFWLRSAVLDLHDPPIHSADPDARVESLEGVVLADAVVERVASGFVRAAGAAWTREGTLLVADAGANTVYRYEPIGRLSVFRSHSGYADTDVDTIPLPGADGIAVDPDERVAFAERGRRRVTRMERTGALATLAELEAPRGIAVSRDGSLWVADASAVVRIDASGAATRTEISRSAVAVALAADESALFVTSDVVLRGALTDGALGALAPFAAPECASIEGLALDDAGDVFVACGDRVRVFGRDARPRGSIVLPEPTHGLAWDAEDPAALYVTTTTSLFRVETLVHGATPPP